MPKPEKCRACKTASVDPSTVPWCAACGKWSTLSVRSHVARRVRARTGYSSGPSEVIARALDQLDKVKA